MADFSEETKSTILTLPGRHFIPLRVLVSMVNKGMVRPIKSCLQTLFGLDWEKELGIFIDFFQNFQQ